MANITIRIDDELKRQAEELFSDLGLNFTTAITAFTKQAVREQRIPFILSKNIPNNQTLEAIEEVNLLKNDPNKKTYSSFKDLVKDVMESDV